MPGMPGDMPESVYERLNREFAPGFIFDEFSGEGTRRMWSDAWQAAELVSSELGLDTDDDIDAFASDRVIDAYLVLLYGYKAVESETTIT